MLGTLERETEKDIITSLVANLLMLRQTGLTILLPVASLMLIIGLVLVPTLFAVGGTANISTANSGITGNATIGIYKLLSQKAFEQFQEGNTSSALGSLSEADQHLLSSITKLNASSGNNLTTAGHNQLAPPVALERRNVTNFLNTTDPQLLSSFTQLNNILNFNMTRP